MPSFKAIINDIIRRSDVILQILDARFVDETRNKKLEWVVKQKKKIMIHVINKCDAVEKSYLDQVKRQFENCVFVSAKHHLGTRMLISKIKILASKKKIKRPIVAVLGYPNVGKSTLINALKGKGSAPTSSEAGYTKGKQYIRISRNVMMIDSPGIIGKGRDDEQDLVLIGAKNPSSMKDPDLAVLELLNTHKGLIERKYNVAIKEDKEETIADIAMKNNLKRKGNLPDIERVSRMILKDWLDWKIR